MSRFSYKTLILILLFLLIPIVLFLRISQRGKQVSAEWFNDSWNYRQRVDITNSSGSDLTDFQVSIDIGTSALIAAGKMQSDCDDIRITDQNGNLLPYWIEENNPGCNQVTDTKIWVKAPSLPTSGAPIYFYYGNTSATSAQNGNDVFEFFDDFSNYTGWSGNTSDYTNSTDGNRTVIQSIGSSNPSIILKPVIAPTNYVVEIEIRDTSETNNNPHPGVIFAGTGSSAYNGVYIRSAGNQVVSATPGSYGAITNTQNIDSNWGIIKAYVYNGLLVSLTYNDIVQTNFNNWDVNNSFTQIGLWNHTYEETAYYDNLKVRKYASSEPTATPQSEEVGGGPIAYWKFDEGVGTSAFDSTSNQYNGEITGAVVNTEDKCISGKCLSFSDTALVNTTLNTNSINTPATITAWFRPTQTTSDTQAIVSGYISNTNRWDVVFNRSLNGKVGFLYHGISGSIYSNNTVPLNSWHQVSVVHIGTSIALYLDGQYQGTSSTAGGLNTTQTIKIGNWYNGAQPFVGSIDEVKIFPYARTADQIKADYAAGLAGMSSSSDSSVNIGGASSKSLSDGLVGYWKFDEGVGTTSVDSSGNNNLSTLSNTGWSSGKFGIGLSFDGVNASTNITDNTDLRLSEGGTITAWIKPTTSGGGGYGRIVDKSSDISCNNGYCLAFGNNNTIQLRVNAESGSTVSNNNAITFGQWQFVAVTFSSTGRKIFVNGTDVTSSSTNLTTLPPNIAGDLSIGNRNGYTDRTFNGLIDEVRLYNRALSASEIRQLADYAPGPVIYYKFENKSGTTVFDSSGGSYNLVMATGNSAPSWTTGKYGSGLRFIGNNQSATGNITPNIVSKVITQSGWYKIDNLSGIQRLLSTNNQGYIQTGLSSNTIFIHSINSAGTDYNIGNVTLPSNCQTGWHYLTIIRDSTLTSSNIKAYCDGVQFTSGDFVNGLNGTYTINYLEIGRASSDQSFNGYLDEFKIYNYARTQKQILQDMVGSPPPGSTTKVSTPLVHYKFDEGFGSTVNNSGSIGTTLNGTLGTGSSSPTWVQGKNNKSLSFSTNKYTSTPDPGTNSALDITESLTLSAWINPSAVDTYRVILNKGNNYEIGSLNGRLYFLYSNSGWKGWQATDISLTTDSWQHVTAVVTFPDNCALYYNGKPLSIGYTWGTGAAVADSNPLTIGMRSGSNYPFSGLIDEVKIYNYALSAEEVKQDYNQGSTFVFGTSNQTIGATTTSLDYCIPGDTTYCSPPVAEWKFEEGVGTTAYDSSGNNFNAKLNSNPTWNIGKFGKALNYNNNSFISIDGSSSLDQILTNMSYGTVEAWVKPNSATSETYDSIVDVVDSGGCASNKGFWLDWRSNTLAGYVDNCQGITASYNLSTTKYQHVVFTWSSTGKKLYVDGIQIASNTNTTPSTFVSNQNITIGYGFGYFDGSIDQVRIYNYARTPAQIAYDYNQGAPVGHWKLDECQGTAIHDSSGNNNHGVLSVGASGTQTSPGTCTTSSTAWGSGKLGKLNASLNFDGSDDLITLSSEPTYSQGGSISTWVKTTDSIARIISLDSTLLGFASSTMMYICADGSGCGITVGSGNVPNDGSWHHIVMSWNNTSLSYYLDGKLITSVADSGAINSSRGSYIGAGDGGSGIQDYFNGQIDDVRIYNYALTATQIKTLYNNGAVTFR